MKAVIEVGGKQYIVAEKETLLVDHLTDGAKELKLTPLLVFDDTNVQVGKPFVEGATVEAAVREPLVKDKKITVVKFEAKKRVKKMRGHRQQHTQLEITKINA